MPDCEHALLDRGANRAAAANAVDRPQVMLVARFGDAGVGQVNAQARAEQRLLDVVRRQRVAGEQLVDVAAANQLAHGRPAAGVDDRRPADDQRLAAAAAVGDQVAGNLAHQRAFGLLGRDAARHEREIAVHRASARPGITRTPAWPVTICMPRRTSIIGMQRGSEVSRCRVSRCRILTDTSTPRYLTPRFHHDAAIHLLVGDFDPVPVEPNFRALVRRAVKPFGKRAVHVGGDQPAVLLRRRHRAMVGNLRQDSVHHVLGVGARTSMTA